MKAKADFIFFPGNNTPDPVRAAVAIYWIVFLVFLVRFVRQVGVPPYSAPRDVEASITVFGLLSAVLIFYAFTIVRLSHGKLWAKNVALFATALGIIATAYSLFAHGLSSERNNVVGIISVAANIVAGLFLLTSKSAAWFKSRIK